MSDSIIILMLLAFHFVGDFLLQSHYMSVNKSKNNRVLIAPVLVYTTTMLFGIVFLAAAISDIHMLMYAAVFAGWLFISHFITDYYTSRWTSSLWRKSQEAAKGMVVFNEDEADEMYRMAELEKNNHIHNFFCVIGFDQLLHAAQIILGFYLILKP